MTTTTSEVFTVEQDGHVATLWLDRPEQRNAMGAAFWSDLPLLMGELGRDDDVRAVVLAAKGPHFTVGLDLKWAGLGIPGIADDDSRGGTTQAARAYASRSSPYGSPRRHQEADVVANGSTQRFGPEPPSFCV